MEEKKVLKISLSTFFLIVAIITIAIMTYLMYKSYNENTSLNEQVVSLQGKVSNLQKDLTENAEGTTINTTTIQSSKPNNTTTGSSTSTSDDAISEEEALKTATNVYETAYKIFSSEEFRNSENFSFEGKQTQGYKINIDKLENVFSKRAIANIKNRLYELNGNYYDSDDITGFLTEIDVSSIFGTTDAGIRPLSIVNSNDTSITATGKLEEGEHTDGDEFPLYIIFVKENGNWVIDLYE